MLDKLSIDLKNYTFPLRNNKKAEALLSKPPIF